MKNLGNLKVFYVKSFLLFLFVLIFISCENSGSSLIDSGEVTKDEEVISDDETVKDDEAVGDDDLAKDDDAGKDDDEVTKDDTDVTDDCIPDCGSRECGLDPVCGTENCGECGNGQVCNNNSGTCIDESCVSDCQSRECGLDPVCGTENCGECGNGQVCNNNSGMCIDESCAPDCQNRECGLDPVCGVQNCGVCSGNDECNAGYCICMSKTCEELGSECGQTDDGCGNSIDCGKCSETQVCGLETPNICGGECTEDKHCSQFYTCDKSSYQCKSMCEEHPGSDVTVDIESVEVTISFTFNGTPLTQEHGTTYSMRSPYVSLSRNEGGTVNRQIPVYKEASGSVPNDWTAVPNTETISLVPGTYRVTYTSNSETLQDDWPMNSSAVLKDDLVISTNGSKVIDIPSVTENISFTFNSAPLTQENGTTYSMHAPYVSLRRNGDGSSFTIPLYNSSSDSVPNDWTAVPNTETISLVPGTYSVTYTHNSETLKDDWPVNDNAVLKDDLVMSTNGSKVIDIPSATENIFFTFNSTSLTQEHGTTYSMRSPYVSLSRNEGGTVNRQIPVYKEASGSVPNDWTAVPNTETISLVPGTYRVTYTSNSETLQDDWPMNSSAVLKDDLVISTNGSKVIDIPSVTENISFTFNSTPLTQENGTTYSMHAPYVSFRRNGDGSSFTISLYNSSSDSVPNDWTAVPNTETISLVPGTYSVTYTCNSETLKDDWPVNDNATMSCYEF